MRFIASRMKWKPPCTVGEVCGGQVSPFREDCAGTPDPRLVKKRGLRAKTRSPRFAVRCRYSLRGVLKRPSATSSRHPRALLF
jgi:hypothetical protein